MTSVFHPHGKIGPLIGNNPDSSATSGNVIGPVFVLIGVPFQYSSVASWNTAGAGGAFSGLTVGAATPAGGTGHLVINVTYDSSFNTLAPTIAAGYKSAISAAVNFYENTITNPITIGVTFGFGEVNGTSIPLNAAGMNVAYYGQLQWSTIYNALTSTSPTSTVQSASRALLSPLDPTNGTGSFKLNTAQYKALGLISSSSQVTDGYVGLSSGIAYSWSQSSIASGTYDAVGILEHEISEVMGRSATLGANNLYSLLDMFHYSAQNDPGTTAPGAAPGAAAGTLNEPFAAGYNASAFSYFSYDGKTVTLPYTTPAQVAGGADVADWTSTVLGDSNGYAFSGTAGLVSTADLQQLNVLGYNLACFASGTRIRTARGDVVIEALRADDRIVTLRNGHLALMSLRWLGRSRIAWRGMDPLRVLPVRIRAGALGQGFPARDLLVSPGHALLLDGLLVHAGALVDGHAIVRQTAMPDIFTYWHIELDTHAILFAEGVATESFLEGTEPFGFDNWHERVAVPYSQELPYPRCKAARQVPALIRRRFAAWPRDQFSVAA